MEPIFAEAISRLKWLHAEYLGYMDGLTTEELDWSPGPEDEFALRPGCTCDGG